MQKQKTGRYFFTALYDEELMVFKTKASFSSQKQSSVTVHGVFLYLAVSGMYSVITHGHKCIILKHILLLFSLNYTKTHSFFPIPVSTTTSPPHPPLAFFSTDVHKRCPLCEVIFPPHFEQRSFEQHVESHWKVCPVCSEQFPLNCQQQLFERHVLTHFDGNVLNFEQIEWRK